ncbi:hypothetical protein [Oleiagrimonas sp. C23AA]|uniref:hypothetical protein n=1 Tax=Oleiagrimonas sp. C23AA TaxID=2719047 RepID=UPI001421FDA4|nr:hypothetical protein [Oleiagrimonas sp. C23AA]NII11661.1 hypothetical protein [Oleiagrimonas sp. C23AA]
MVNEWFWPVVVVLVGTAWRGVLSEKHHAFMWRQLQQLAKAQGVKLEAEALATVRPHLERNQKMPAVRMFRRLTGADPFTARQMVEQEMAEVALALATGGPAAGSSP